MKRSQQVIIRARGLLAGLTVLVLCQSSRAGEFHVSPDGDDGNPGTRQEPLATIRAARDAARAMGGRGHVLLLAPGCYFNEHSISLDDRDSGLTIKGGNPGA